MMLGGAKVVVLRVLAPPPWQERLLWNERTAPYPLRRIRSAVAATGGRRQLGRCHELPEQRRSPTPLSRRRPAPAMVSGSYLVPISSASRYSPPT